MSGPYAEGGPHGVTDAPQQLSDDQRAGRERTPCIGRHGYAQHAHPCEHPAVVELVVHEPGSETRLIAPVCFGHATELMHGAPAEHVLDLYRYTLDRI